MTILASYLLHGLRHEWHGAAHAALVLDRAAHALRTASDHTGLSLPLPAAGSPCQPQPVAVPRTDLRDLQVLRVPVVPAVSMGAVSSYASCMACYIHSMGAVSMGAVQEAAERQQSRGTEKGF